jgi:hypothetical protein
MSPDQRVGRVVPRRTTEPNDEAANLKTLGSKLTKADIAAFTKAAERRTGRSAYDDWRTIGRIYKKASDLALTESGQESRHNPVYKRAFSRIIEVLPPIANTPGSCEQYRIALLNIEDNEPAFSKWYDKHEPRASNPVDLWKAFRDRSKPRTQEPNERSFSKHQQELARVQQEAADKIAMLTDQIRDLGGDPSATTPSVDWLLRRAWDRQASLSGDNPNSAFGVLLNRLVSIAAEHGATYDANRVQQLIELSFEEVDADDAA